MSVLIFSLVLTLIFMSVAIVALPALKILKDDQLVLILLLSEFLFLPGTGTQFELKHIIVPIFAFMLFFRERGFNSLRKKNFAYTLGVLVYFGIAFYWFIRNGMLPNYVSGNEDSNYGNFIVFYNIFCNSCLFFIGMNINFNLIRISRIIKYLGLLLSLQVLLMFIGKISNSFYVPILMPGRGDSRIITSAFSDMNRDGNLSQYCYFGALFVAASFNKFRSLIIIGLAGINLLFGGGRTDLISIIFILFVCELLERGVTAWLVLKISGSAIVLLSVFWLSGNYLTIGQLDRFSDILNPMESSEMDSNNNGRMAMWTYSLEKFREKPILGNGVSRKNSVSGGLAYARNVSLGSSHQFYLSVLYSFGLVGFFSLMYTILRSFSLIRKVRRFDTTGVINFVLLLLLSYVLVQFWTSGGVKKFYMLLFLFLGIVPQFSKLKKKSEVYI